MRISLTNEAPLSKDEILGLEREIYQKAEIETGTEHEPVRNEDVLARKSCLLEDRLYNLPQNIFILDRHADRPIVGRKLLSKLNREQKITAPNCSRISAPMLLGILKEKSTAGSSVRIEYFPFSKGEKLWSFERIKTDRACDIYFPYQHHDFFTGLEKTTPPDGWKLRRDKVESLGHGEEHIRRYTREFLKDIIKGGERVYDPACSTGQFLRELKKAFSNILTIGHDLSQEMIDYAADYLDEALCCDARCSPLAPESIDIMFLRFLNEEIVTKADAYKILEILLSKVKKGGWVFCFGHTPVLIEKESFVMYGLTIAECNGYDQESDSIFQFYAMRKCP